MPVFLSFSCFLDLNYAHYLFFLLFLPVFSAFVVAIILRKAV